MAIPFDFAFSIDTLIRVGVLLLGSVVAHRIMHALVARLNNIVARGPESAAAHKERVNTLEGVIHSIVSIAIWGLALFMVLAEFGVNIAPLIASAGIVGLAIGFGSQQLVRDFLGGFFVLLENQYGKGDKIEIAGKIGTVQAVSLRTTVLKDDNNNTHIIPNSAISVVTRLKQDP